ncbi:sugar phosphate isomerase/epimerase [Tsuneonella sp. CC-YZS046]|uniref:sugar phosphate isomerase/epimerase family protein n=1 Tax=Tsuneonella sp. CC-YZS046 TaxID=3042152 RepID=UPI002D799AE8|nr:sugar phosphate isomerase/epimerase [Tsuneonella sp. CC-YZS046]WRO65724.1 sugar phosphate isomerase/epimerase [Tsuneonella sp. CC-YZS046]
MSQPKLIASYFTLAGNIIPFASSDPAPFGLKERAEAAAAAGFVGIGLETNDLAHYVRTIGYGGIRKIMADAGLDYIEFEVLTDWFTEGERRAASDANRAFLLEAAAELGAAQIKTVGELFLAPGPASVSSWPLEKVGDDFGQLCREAAKAGTRVSIELVPGAAIQDLETGRRVVDHASEPNGGLLIDIWHMARGGISYDDVANLPPYLVTAVEVDDAMKQQVGTIFEDTINNRKLPGEGELDVPAFLHSIMLTGYQGVYGIEIVSDEHRRRTLEDAARSSFDSTMAQFEKARSLGSGPVDGVSRGGASAG